MKKRNVHWTVVSLLMLTLMGCEEEPQAKFEVNTRTPLAGEKVYITDLSLESPYSWKWSITPSFFDYVDGTDSNSQHPVVRFNKVGIYSVSLTASNGSGSHTKKEEDYFNVQEAESEVEISWTEKAEMPVALSWTKACVLGDKIYIAGGGKENEKGDLVSDNILLVYDPINDSWDTSKAKMKRGLFGHSIDAVNGKIYVMGGASAPGPCLGSIEVYDPVTNVWDDYGTLPRGMSGHGSCVLDGKIYVAGGNQIALSEGLMNDFYVYDPEKRSWTSLAPLPTINTYLGMCSYKNKIYAIGGTNAYPWDGLSTIQVYDPITDSWECNSHLRVGRWGLAVVSVKDMIVCSGGSFVGGFRGVSSTEVYYPDPDLVLNASSITEGRQGVAGCVYKDKIYIFGGCIGVTPNWGNNTSSTLEGVIQ